MIDHYTDHAANERTFLAWVRTAIAIIAFGLVVERFDLLLRVTSESLAGHASSSGSHLVTRISGFLLILFGSGVIVLATIRFRRTAKAIDDPKTHTKVGTRVDVAVSGLLVLLGGVLFVYLAYAASRL